jgi:PAS domain S-box-containing protein
MTKNHNQLKKENETLRKELSNVLWATNSATWVWNYKTGYLDYNEKKAKAIGYEKHELDNNYETFTSKVHPDDYKATMQAMVDLLSGKKDVYEVTYRIQAKDGTYKWFHDKGRIISFQDNGKPLLIEGVATDVTKQKTVEEQLKNSEFRSSALLSVIPDLMFRLDLNGVIIDYKAEKDDLYEQRLDELRGVVIMDHLPPDIAEKTSYYINKALSENKIQYYTYQLEVPGSGLHYYEARMIPSGEKEVTAIVRDVTEREETIKRLIESEARSTALLNAIPDLMFRLSKDGVYLDYSADVSDLAVQDQTIIGKNVKEIMPANFANRTLELIADALKYGVMQSYEYKMFVPGKGLSYFESRIMPTINDEVISIVRNITERKINEKALRESQEKFRLIAENTSDAVMIFDGDTLKINYVSPSIKKITGYDIEEEIGKGPDEIYQMIHPEDRKVTFDKLYKAIEDKKESLIYTYKMFHKNGHIIWRQDSARFIYNREGKHLRSYVVARDITKQKKEELELLKLQTAIEQSTASIVITGFDGNIEYVNPGFELITGYQASELIGENPNVLNAGTNSKEYYKELWDTIKSGKTWTGEFHNKRKSGELYWESAIISPVRDEKGEITHFVGVKEDITENKKLIAELRQAKDKAEESDRLKSAFLTNMSHEIRTPLNALVGFSTIIASKSLTEDKLNKYSELISKNAKLLLNVINDILDISKIEAGQIEINLTDIDAYKEIIDISKSLKSLINEKTTNAKLKIDCEDKGVIVKADLMRFRQILTNLISNAFKFTDRGYVKIGFCIKNKEAVFYVKDTGIGISQAMQELIFDPFKQASYENGKFFGGNGLGLPISKAYVEMMGGKMWLESIEGRGSKFYFSLPSKD